MTHSIMALLGVGIYGACMALGIDLPAEAGLLFVGFGGSDSRTTSNTTNVQETRTLNLSDLEGINVAGLEDSELALNIEQIDAGLIDSVRDISRDSFDTSRSIADDANALAGQAIRANEGALEESLDFGGEVFAGGLEGVRAAGRDAQDFSSDVLYQYTSGQREALNTVADVVQENSRTALATLSDAIGGAAAATRSDATDVLNNIVKYGAIALGVGALAYAITRSA